MTITERKLRLRSCQRRNDFGFLGSGDVDVFCQLVGRDRVAPNPRRYFHVEASQEYLGGFEVFG